MYCLMYYNESGQRRGALIGFGTGVGVGIGWRDSHATSQFLKFSNQNFRGQTLPTLKDRFFEMTSNITKSGDATSTDKKD